MERNFFLFHGQEENIAARKDESDGGGWRPVQDDRNGKAKRTKKSGKHTSEHHHDLQSVRK